jgi:hypothetical protein
MVSADRMNAGTKGGDLTARDRKETGWEGRRKGKKE